MQELRSPCTAETETESKRARGVFSRIPNLWWIEGGSDEAGKKFRGAEQKNSIFFIFS